MRRLLLTGFIICVAISPEVGAQVWSAKLDDTVRFYQPTEIGAVIVGTKKSVYAVDSISGDVLWRRKDPSLDENDVAPIPGTDMVLLSFEQGSRTRIEAVDALNGDRLWQSDKLRGAVMQMAVEPQANLLAVVLAKDAKGALNNGFKRKPVVHVLDLSSGDELWKHELGEVEMMPTRWSEKDDVAYSLDNYHPPIFADRRLYLFYEGVTSYDARDGGERTRERFRVNEEALALTEAAPVADEAFIYTSGRGHVRAISRVTGKVAWEAKDLGVTPELMLANGVLYARMGGQFTRLKDGETVERGPYGVAAIATRTGKLLWQYKAADKGITNLVVNDETAVTVADHDEVITISAANGKRVAHVAHHVKQPAFALLNERGEVVVGGQEDIAAFKGGAQIWRGHYPPPGRGILKTVAAVAARAASLYFRYGGTVSSAFRGVQIASTITSLSWSGLATRSSFSNLQTLATNLVTGSARSYGQEFKSFGVISKLRSGINDPGLRSAINDPAGQVRERIRGNLADRRPRDVDERLLDRLDPAHQLDRLSKFLWHRDRLAALRGNWMYFYTDLGGDAGHSLAGININGTTGGVWERAVRVADVDERFITDEVNEKLYTARGNQLLAYSLSQYSRRFTQ